MEGKWCLEKVGDDVYLVSNGCRSRNKKGELQGAIETASCVNKNEIRVITESLLFLLIFLEVFIIDIEVSLNKCFTYNINITHSFLFLKLNKTIQ